MAHTKLPSISILCWHRYTLHTNGHDNWEISFSCLRHSLSLAPHVPTAVRLGRNTSGISSKFLKETSSDSGVKKTFADGAETITVVVAHNQLPDFLETFFACTGSIFIKYITQVCLRFFIGETKHIKERRFQGKNFRNVITDSQIVHGDRQYTVQKQVRTVPSPMPFFITLKKVRRKLSLVVTFS